MSDITLESLIQEHKDRIPLLQENSEFPDIIEYPDMGEYYKWISKTTRFLEIKFPRDKHIKEFKKINHQPKNMLIINHIHNSN